MSLRKLISVRTRIAMTAALLVVLSLVLPSSSFLNRVAVRTVLADTTPQTLPFSQNWTTTTLITADDNWTGVPGIIGYRGDDAAAGTAVDPQTVTQDLSAVTDVNANRNDPNLFTTGGVTEFDGIADPVVALQGSGTADFPNLVISLNTTGQTSVNVSYNLRDIDGSTDNAVQAVALQYRVGASGAYTNLPAGFVADASTGPSLATLVTPVSVTLPAACDNQAVVQVRVITSNAVGSDEWIGVDDISITAGGGGGTPTLNIGDVTQAEGNAGTTAFTFNVSLTGGVAPGGGVTFNASTQDGSINPANAPSDYTALVNQPGSISAGGSSTTVTVQVNGDMTTEPNETFFVNITSVVGANAGDVQGLGTINNDDVGLTPIHTIQGSGNSSPLVANVITTTGIVTGLRSNGFFLQEPDATVDADSNTSEGIFVFTSSAPPAAAVVGNNVQVTATVAEFVPAADPGTQSQTELTGPTVTTNSSGNPLPAPHTITSAETLVNNINNLEKYEGMRVHVDSLTVSAPTGGNVDEANATSSSFGDFYGVVTGVARPFREPGIELPYPVPTPYPSGTAPASVPIFDANPERIRVNSLGLTGSVDLQVATGAVVTGITGPLDFGFRTYTIDTDPPAITPTPLVAGGATIAPVPVPNARELTIASFNMQRFFDTTDDPSVSDVVLTTTAFNNRLNKASLTIRNVMNLPDVVGVEEMENLTTLQSVATKVNNDEVAAAHPNPNYQAYLVEGNDVGGIDVGFLVKTSRIAVNSATQYNKTETFTDPSTGTSATLNDRPPLVLRASIVQPSGSTLFFSVIVNHLRSLGSVTLTTNAGAHTRVKKQKEAESLATLINEMQNGGARQVLPYDTNIVSVGDYNAFQFNDGYADVMGTVRGVPTPANQVVEASPDLNNPDLTDLIGLLPAAQQYSYTFGGNAQALDHTIVNPNMLNRFSRFAYARMDSDFPDSLRNDPNRPERISDHDPEVAYFTMAIPTATAGVVSGRITDPNGLPIAGAVVNLSGTQNRKFITDANGNYLFDNVETNGFYTVRPQRANYSFSPAERSFSQLGISTEATFTGSSVAIVVNPLDTPEYFVRQHYLDFLSREPDESGLNFWSDQMLSCGGDSACVERRTINVSAAYFLSIEFQQTGGLVDSLYRASYGRAPRYAEFMPDARTVGQGVMVGSADWAQRLAANKQAFLSAWVARPDFRAAYDGLSSHDYVAQLLGNTGISFTPDEREALVSSLTNGTATRAELLESIAGDERFVGAKRNGMFVMMQYFGYLRRDPDPGGYQFWLAKLNQFNGNFEQAEMVKAFIVSGEYRARFAR